MRAWLGFWVPTAVVLGLGFTVTSVVLTIGAGGTAFASWMGAFSLVLGLFAGPVVLGIWWWITLGLLFASLRAVHHSPRRGNEPG